MKAYQPVRPARVVTEPIGTQAVSVRIWDAPGKPSLLALHGWGDCGASFQFIADALGGDITLIAPDWRGFGDSRSDEQTYFFPNYLADLDALVSRFFPDEPASLLGHSMGGNVAGLYAGVRPDSVARLINLEGFGLPDTDPAAAPQRYAKWLDSLAAAPRQPDYADSVELAERIRRRTPRLALDKALYLAEHWARPDPSSARWRLRAEPAHRRPNPVLYRREEACACWRQTRAGVLLVRGADGDMPIGLAAAAEEYAEALAGRCHGIEVLTECGHSPHVERPTALAELIRRYWDRLAGGE